MIGSEKLPVFGVLLSLIVALLLTLMPFSRDVAAMMPQWTLLVVLFWLTQLPDRLSVGFAFISGLLLDCVSGTILGLYAFIFVFVAYLALKIRVTLRAFPMWQQMVIVAGFVCVALLLQYMMSAVVFVGVFVNSLWLSIVSSAVVWPMLSMLLQKFSRKSVYIL